MNLWETRNLAFGSLQRELRAEADLLDEGFQLLEDTAQKLFAVDPQTPFVRITALTAVKARNLLHCSYSLALDGHAQESGAIGRVFVEAVELLAYLNADPTRVSEVIDNRLPSAGERAKKIEGRLKQLREHWNIHASHFQATYESVSHILDLSAGKLVARQQFKASVLRTNLKHLFVFLLWACLESLRSLAESTSDPQETLALTLEHLRQEGFKSFSVVQNFLGSGLEI